MSEQQIPPGFQPASPAQVYELLKQNVDNEWRKTSNTLHGSWTVALLTAALKGMPSDLPPLLREQPSVWASLEVMACQLAGVCHIYGANAEIARDHLLRTVEREFENARALADQMRKDGIL